MEVTGPSPQPVSDLFGLEVGLRLPELTLVPSQTQRGSLYQQALRPAPPSTLPPGPSPAGLLLLPTGKPAVYERAGKGRVDRVKVGFILIL